MAPWGSANNIKSALPLMFEAYKTFMPPFITSLALFTRFGCSLKMNKLKKEEFLLFLPKCSLILTVH